MSRLKIRWHGANQIVILASQYLYLLRIAAWVVVLYNFTLVNFQFYTLIKSEDDGVVLASMVWGKTDENRVGLLVLCAKTWTEIGRCEFITNGPVPKCLHGWFAPDSKWNFFRLVFFTVKSNLFITNTNSSVQTWNASNKSYQNNSRQMV